MRASPPTPRGAPDAADAFERFRAQRRFASLDGLRAVAMLAVLWHHTVGGPGGFGANLFFLLSGFLVTTVLLRQRARAGTIDVPRFRVRRARRLYPLYFAVLGLYVLLVTFVEPPGRARDAFFAHLPSFATFTSNLVVRLDDEHVIFYFAWSLAAQEQFYLFWPELLKRARARTAACVAAALLALVYLTRARLLDGVLLPGTVPRTLALSLMAALPLGALLALALRSRAAFTHARRLLGHPWASAVTLAAALVLWRAPGVPDPLLHAALLALTAACVLGEEHALTRLLRWRPLVHVGAVSYGIYLLHMLCHNAAERALHAAGIIARPADFALTAALAITVATLSQRYFESRFVAQADEPSEAASAPPAPSAEPAPADRRRAA